MCGRYYIAEDDAAEELRQIIEAVNRRNPDAKTGGEMPIRGILEGDTIPPTTLTCPAGSIEVPLTTLTLAPAAIGLSETIGASWGERCAALLAEHGPFQLVYLETILRAADIRASRK